MLREGAEGEEEVGVAGWRRLPGRQSPCVGPCPGPAGDGPGRRSGGGAPRVEEQGGAPLGRSGGARAEVGSLETAAASVGEEWEEEVYRACRQRVRGEAEGGAGEAEGGECWS